MSLAALFALAALTACNKGNADKPAGDTKAPASAAQSAAQGAAEPAGPHPALLDPSKATEQAPEKFTVKLETTKGDILIDVTRAWAPQGADRFYNLVKIGYYNDVAFFRVISGFMAQVGISGDPKVNEAWRPARIKDDPVTQSNTRGMVTFAKTGMPDSRTTQIFLNFKDNSNLDRMGFAPFGKVQSMDVVDQIYSGYGEGAPRGQGPSQGRLQGEGNSYLKAEFPDMDYIKKASIVQ
ncbi:MAG: peptidylprolyl isomerase [Myxococcales bacterium]|nr:peptidylprolyl isomerase [Myxococcales bacterium]